MELNEIKCQFCDVFIKNTPRSIGSHIGYWHKDKSKELFHQPTSFNIKCLECNQLVANSKNVLGRHLRKSHKIEYVDYIVKHEYNNVWPVCACGCNERLKFHKGFSSHVDGHSSRGENNGMYGKRGSDNPNTGKIRTAEMRERYSSGAKKSWADFNVNRRQIFTEEYAENMRNVINEVFATTDIREKIGEGVRKNLEEHPELREVFRENAIRLIEAGISGPHNSKTEWKLNPFSSQEEYMHSSWETKFLDECIANNTPVTKKHQIRIRYKDFNDVEHVYIPDFVSEQLKMIYEIKGRQDETTQEKYIALDIWCNANNYKHVLLTYNEKNKQFIELQLV